MYGRKIWVVMNAIITVLEGFNYRIARHIAGMTAKKGDGGEWEWDSAEAALETTGIWKIKEYVRRWTAKINEYVAIIPI